MFVVPGKNQPGILMQFYHVQSKKNTAYPCNVLL